MNVKDGSTSKGLESRHGVADEPVCHRRRLHDNAIGLPGRQESRVYGRALPDNKEGLDHDHQKRE